MMNQFLMEWYKIERMQALEEALDTRFGNHFRGSKARRKNAEKELKKELAELLKDIVGRNPNARGSRE